MPCSGSADETKRHKQTSARGSNNFAPPSIFRGGADVMSALRRLLARHGACEQNHPRKENSFKNNGVVVHNPGGSEDSWDLVDVFWVN